MVSLLGTLVPTPDAVQLRRYLGDGPDGPRWGEPVGGYGRWEQSTRQLQTPDGRVVTVTAVVFLPAAWEPQVGDEVARGGGAADWRRVETVDTLTWFDGTVMHHEVMVS